MTEKQKIDDIISLWTFLQIHIKNNVKVSFADLSFELETVIKDYLNVFQDKSDFYSNINEVRPNYPAIDLISKKSHVAIQVTTTADTKKVKETIETYKRYNLNFSELIIIGLDSSYSTKNTDNVKVYGIEYLINKAKFATNAQKDELYDILHRQIPLNTLYPIDDKTCFEIVFKVIDRSALRDYTEVEGSYERMEKGLSEIKEIITTGQISGKSIRAKALVEYTQPIQNELRNIEYDISTIIQIYNKAKNRSNGYCLCLTMDERKQIDDLKESIMDKTNILSETLGLPLRIRKMSRWN
ncbi:MAG: SMEK domain-containing protein [Tannerella sp.]|jgi:hypothetical protein|nr:SMEK domain-containing protein [Tannerella sp.]